MEQWEFTTGDDGETPIVTSEKECICVLEGNAHTGLDPNKTGPLIAAAPELLAALKRLECAAREREYTMGDPCGLLTCKAELAAAAKIARAVIAKAGGK